MRKALLGFSALLVLAAGLFVWAQRIQKSPENEEGALGAKDAVLPQVASPRQFDGAYTKTAAPKSTDERQREI